MISSIAGMKRHAVYVLIFDYLRTLNVKHLINDNAKSSFMCSLLIYMDTQQNSRGTVLNFTQSPTVRSAEWKVINFFIINTS